MRHDQLRKLCDELIADRHSEEYIKRSGIALAFASVIPELLDRLEAAEQEAAKLRGLCRSALDILGDEVMPAALDEPAAERFELVLSLTHALGEEPRDA